MSNKDAAQDQVSSVRRIQSMIEAMVREIHNKNLDSVTKILTEINNLLVHLSDTYPNIKKDKHAGHLAHHIQEMSAELKKGPHDPTEYYIHLEDIAANMIKAARDIHIHKPGPFSWIGRIFR